MVEKIPNMGMSILRVNFTFNLNGVNIYRYSVYNYRAVKRGDKHMHIHVRYNK